MASIIQYSDNSYGFYGEHMISEEGRVAAELDAFYRLATYVAERRAGRVISFARNNGIDLDDIEVQSNLVSHAKAIRARDEENTYLADEWLRDLL